MCLDMLVHQRQTEIDVLGSKIAETAKILASPPPTCAYFLLRLAIRARPAPSGQLRQSTSFPKIINFCHQRNPAEAGHYPTCALTSTPRTTTCCGGFKIIRGAPGIFSNFMDVKIILMEDNEGLITGWMALAIVLAVLFL